MNDQKKILIIDDDKDLLQMYKFVFSNNGFLVETLQDSGKILDTVKINKYDVILMDLLFPGGDNLQTIFQIRAKGALNSNTPVIAMTNLDSGEQTKKAREYGANACLFKTELTPDNLVSKVLEIVNA
jgi:Response regulators consisting of a CheY-like receiver domain and a winged-helix DNA-binding domain